MTSQAVKDNMSNATCEKCKWFSAAGNVCYLHDALPYENYIPCGKDGFKPKA